MSKTSLRLRITLLVGFILILLTTVLTALTIMSANRHFVASPLDILQITPFTGVDPQLFDVQKNTLQLTEQEISLENVEGFSFNGNVEITAVTTSMQMHFATAQKSFSHQSITVLGGIIACGLAGTYWIMGRALRPLTVLSTTIHDINEHNLSKAIPGASAQDEVGSITASFNGMLQRLRNSFEQQKRFSASAAHELKTPLATMKTSLQVLRLDDAPSPEDYQETMELLEQNVDRLISTVNDLLLLSSEGETELDDEIALLSLFREIVDELAEAIAEKNLSCILPSSDYLISGNRMLLRSAFFNLVENAVKYNREGGRVEVEFQPRPDGQTCIAIRDTGIGMAEEAVARVFEPFYRADCPDVCRIPGNGLGMSIIQAIIESHGGEIHLESRQHVGTNVNVAL